jgi:hypothetical protein
MIALPALSDSGHPTFDAGHAAAAIEHRDVSEWAAANDIPTNHEG